jgi:hypothetical protein
VGGLKKNVPVLTVCFSIFGNAILRREAKNKNVFCNRKTVYGVGKYLCLVPVSKC